MTRASTVPVAGSGQAFAQTLGVRRALTSLSPGPNVPTALFQVGPWTINAYCVDDGGGTAHAALKLSVGAGEGLLAVNTGAGGWTTDRFTGESTSALAQTASTASVATAGGQFIANDAGLLNVLSGTVLASVDAPDFSSTPTCVFGYEGSGS